MTREELHAILTQVTEEILDRMRHDGFYHEGVKRFDPIVYDINNGQCEEWAYAAAELIPEAFPAWMDEDHCVLVYRGRFYDADCPDGVDDVEDLPMFAEPEHPRPEP
jgi:hypothetical protein